MSEPEFKSFRHIVPPLRMFHGADSLLQIGRELERLNSRRAVILCGATLGRDARALDLIRSSMEGRYAGTYSGVRSQSPLPAVEEAAGELKRLEADAVVAVGGGSAIVTARGASILLAEHRPARDLCTTSLGPGRLVSPKLLAPKLPQLVVPTTPTTASIKAGSAILDPLTGERLALFDPKTRAHAIFLHPALLQTASRELFVSAGLNTLALTVEGLMSRSGDPLSDGLLIHAARLLVRRLPGAANSDDFSVRSDLMMASLMCGHGTDYTGAGIAIPLGHAISAKFRLDSGLSDAIILPHVLRFNADSAREGLEKLAIALNISPVERGALVEMINEAFGVLFRELGLPARLRDVGVTRDSLPELSEIAINDWYIQNNPRKVRDAAELFGILEEAW